MATKLQNSPTVAHLRAMENIMNTLRRMWSDDEGQDLAEYGLLLILICVALVTAIGLFKDQIVGAFTAATTALTPAT